jgi:hypothetical protein
MRFSLKWLLAAMLYAAIVAAAFARPHWALVSVFWGATFLAVVYALVITLAGNGRRRYVASGFAVASVLLVVSSRMAPEASLADRFVTLAFPPQYSQSGYVMTSAGRRPVFDRRLQTNRDANLLRTQMANAVAAILAGLAGSALGVVAHRRGQTAEN